VKKQFIIERAQSKALDRWYVVGTAPFDSLEAAEETLRGVLEHAPPDGPTPVYRVTTIYTR